MRNYGAPLPATDGGTGVTTASAELARIAAVGFGASQSLSAAQQNQARQNIGFTRTAVSDAAYTALASDSMVAYTALTAARTVTLPAASAYPVGFELVIVDESGSCSSSNTITIARAGSDTINGLTTAVLSTAYSYFALVSNGSSKWTIVDSIVIASSAAGSGAPTAYNTRALPYLATVADSGTAINPTGTGVLTLRPATAVSGWNVWIKKRDDGGAATITPSSGTIDGLASIVAYKEEFQIYYDSAASTSAGAPVYRTQGRQRGWIDFGAFSVTSGTSAVSVTAGAGDSEIRDVEINLTGYVPSTSGSLSLSVNQAGSAGTIVGEQIQFSGSTAQCNTLSGTSVQIAATATAATHCRVCLQNIQSTTSYGVAITNTASASTNARMTDAALSTGGAVSSFSLTPSAGTISAGNYNVRLYRP